MGGGERGKMASTAATESLEDKQKCTMHDENETIISQMKTKLQLTIIK